jgi:tetratricopeptide (TPR) repeat protein
MAERNTLDAWSALYVAGTAAAGACALPALLALNAQPADLRSFAGFHLLATAIAGLLMLLAWRLGWLAQDRPHDRTMWHLVLIGAVAVLGMPGAAACLVGFVAHHGFARHSRPFQEWYHELFPEEHHDLAERLYEELARTAHRQGQDAEVVPFVDVIRHGKTAHKRIAIGLMSRHFRPEFATALRLALADIENSVRIQAATAIAGVENRFLERMMSLREQLAQRESKSLLLDLARQYDRYAFCGLLDEDRERRNREDARAFFARYLELEPADVEARVAYGRLLLKLGQLEQAREWFADTRARHGGTTRMDSWFMQTLYELRDFAALRTLAQEVAATLPEDMPSVFRETVQLWAGQRA